MTEAERVARRKAAQKAWRDANRERLREYDRRRYLANREAQLAKIIAWRDANPERARAADVAHREAHREERRANAREWARAHPQETKARLDSWRAANPLRVARISRRASAVRRARKVDAAVIETVDILVLAERDGWRCGICSEPVDASLRWPDPMCATHDHIIPLARGGDHSYANAQLAHARCNRRKWAA